MWTPSLRTEDMARYCRQMLVPGFGAPTQVTLSRLGVLIIGAGGLGCPVGMYLAAAGVGRIGVVDDDVVDTSNLHRQVAHREVDRGEAKAASLARAMAAVNSGVAITPYATRFSAANGAALVAEYDIVVDATDNPGTRYLLNDACVLGGRPLVSGAALGMDGQVSVYNHAGGPCYRCMYPLPPPPSMVPTCANAGVLGPITGVIGSLQALEVLKLAASMAAARVDAVIAQAGVLAGEGATLPTTTPAECAPPPSLISVPVVALAAACPPGTPASMPAVGIGAPLSQRMLVLDGTESRFRTVALRARRPDCAVCGHAPSITTLAQSHEWCATHSLLTSDQEGGAAGGASVTTAPTLPCECDAVTAVAASLVPSVSGSDFLAAMQARGSGGGGSHDSDSKEGARHGSVAPTPLVLDVRERQQFHMLAVENSVNIPLPELARSVPATAATLAGHSPVYVLCRRGVDSMVATRLLVDAGVPALDVRGGLRAVAEASREGSGGASTVDWAGAWY